MSRPKPERLERRRTPTQWSIADVTDSERSMGRSRWWAYIGTHWMAVGAPQAFTHDAFCDLFREAVVRELQPSDDRLVATLRTPIPLGGLHHLGQALEEVYGRGLEIQPFEPGDFARVEFGPRGDPRRTQRINEPVAPIFDPVAVDPTGPARTAGDDYFGVGGVGTPAFGEPGGH